MNKGSIVERLCSDLIAKNRDINGLLYFTLLTSLFCFSEIFFGFMGSLHNTGKMANRSPQLIAEEIDGFQLHKGAHSLVNSLEN